MNRQHGDWLQQALTDLETSAPIAAPPRLGRAPYSGRWRLVAAAAIFPLALVGGFLLMRLVTPQPVGESSPTPAFASSSAPASPSTAPATTSPSPTPLPSAEDPSPAAFAVSWDASTWTEQSVPEAVAYDEATATWLAVGTGGWISDDGLAWSPVPFEQPPCPYPLCTQAWALDLIRTADAWLAIGRIGGQGSDAAMLVTWRSSDGRSWEVVADPVEPTAQRAAAASNGATIVVASTGLTGPDDPGGVQVSQDGGASWSSSEPIGGNPWGAYGDEDGFVVVGARTQNVFEPNSMFFEPVIAASTDGFSWTPAVGLPTSTGTVRAIERTADGVYVATGMSMDGRVFVWTSPDLVTWFESVLSEPSDELLPGTTFQTSFLAANDQALLLLVSFGDAFGGSTSGAAAWVSRDGVTWESTDLPDLPSGAPTRPTTVGARPDAAVAFGTKYEIPDDDAPEHIVWRARIRTLEP